LPIVINLLSAGTGFAPQRSEFKNSIVIGARDIEGRATESAFTLPKFIRED
jgi:hypothetical protein